tara:strand:+ start:695 stop:961 length:267 start_codon:yes stop_codon:yes gene_type:complete
MSISDKDKLHKLKQIKIDKLEEKLDKDIRGYDHIMDYKKDHSAGLVTDWVDENIQIIIQQHNAEIEKVKKMKIEDFTLNEQKEVDKSL